MEPSESEQPPSHLRDAGKKLFLELAHAHDIADAAGIALLTAACEARDRMTEAQEAIARDGAVIKDRYDGMRAHPACALEKDSRAGFLAALKALNLEVEPLRDRAGRPGSNARHAHKA